MRPSSRRDSAARRADVLLVLGSANSSNSVRLAEVARLRAAYLD
ncbi:hypothetical protein [Phenylobacterium sp.]